MLRMTDEAVVGEIKGTSTLNNARREFSHWSAKIEQAGQQQRKPLTSIELRRLEFEAVVAIALAIGVKLKPQTFGKETA